VGREKEQGIYPDREKGISKGAGKTSKHVGCKRRGAGNASGQKEGNEEEHGIHPDKKENEEQGIKTRSRVVERRNRKKIRLDKGRGEDKSMENIHPEKRRGKSEEKEYIQTTGGGGETKGAVKKIHPDKERRQEE
jgi:hypothetical protein